MNLEVLKKKNNGIMLLSCEKGKSQKVFVIYDSLGTAGLLLAAIIFSVFVKDNYVLAGKLTAVSYGIAALLSLGLTEVKNIFKQVIKNKELLLFLIAVAFMTQAHQTITVFLTQLQYVRSGMTSSAMGYVFILPLAGIISSKSAWVTTRLGTKKNRNNTFSYCNNNLSCFSSYPKPLFIS